MDPEQRMKTVFMVEDEVLLSDLFAEYVQMIPELKFLGSSGDGAEAMRMCLELVPDLIILDIRLPEVNGLEMLLLLRRKLPDTRIVVFSGSLDARSVRTALDCDAHGFVEKAYGLEELNKAIRLILSGERYYSAGARDYVNKLRARNH